MRCAWIVLGGLSLAACSDERSTDELGESGSETAIAESESESESSSTSSSSTSSSTTSTDDASESDSGSTSETGSSESESQSESSDTASTDTGDPLPDCAPLLHAPPATVIDGLPAVAIDILGLEALMSFDLAGAQAQVDVTMTFQLGPDPGMPIFDLRQSIAQAELDGQPLDPALLGAHEFGKGIAFGFRILAQDLDACSLHTLTLSYPLAVPNAPAAGGLSWASNPARLNFDTWLSDLNPGRYLESWLPANLPFDRHPLSLGITLTNAEVAHTLITNAAFEPLAEHDWQLEFPDSMTAMGPLIVVVPTEELTQAAGIHAAANGQDIPYFVHLHQSVATPITSFETELRAHLDEFVLSTGDFQHPAMTVYIGASLRSMEYDGALTTKPVDLEHEAFHSWWARGIQPATYADGWIDEAWDMYNTTVGLSFTSEPFNWADAAVELHDPHPFARDTPDLSYTHGRRVFAGLAAVMGVAELRTAMADLYIGVGPLGSLTTAQLEQHLYCTSGELVDIRQGFWRFVYGRGGVVEDAPLDYCG